MKEQNEGLKKIEITRKLHVKAGTADVLIANADIEHFVIWDTLHESVDVICQVYVCLKQSRLIFITTYCYAYYYYYLLVLLFLLLLLILQKLLVPMYYKENQNDTH